MHIRKMRALLVEGNRDNLVLIRQAFTASAEMGELHEAQSLQEACLHLALTSPDVIIAALRLPDGRGVELIPANEEDAAYPVIMLISPDDPDALDEVMQAGVWDYVMTSAVTLADMPRTTARTLRAWRHARQQRQLEQVIQYRDAQLQQAQRQEAIAVSARLTAHDFNNSLSFILGYTQMALDEIPHDSRTRRFLQEVQSAGQEAKERVQQFLAFGRSAEQPSTLVPFQSIVTAVLKRFRVSCTVPMWLEASEDTGFVLANQAQLQQAFLYLYAQAVHAIDESGDGLAVRIDVVETDAALHTRHPELHASFYLRMRIYSRSRSVAPECEETHAEPLFRLGRGSGRTELELAIVRAIVASHEGAFDVPSPSNQAFVVYLPHVAAGPHPGSQELRGTR